ncbi:hypothetical protein GGF32_009830 [Allomyces javanicus]|nr:hypothetical protein GGF32_009830 [Allomyces javanicus]
MTQPLTSHLEPRLSGLPPLIIEGIIDHLRGKTPHAHVYKRWIARDLARLARTCHTLRAPAASALLDEFAALFVDSRNFATLGLAYLDRAAQLVFLGRFDVRVEGPPPLAWSNSSATSIATTSDTTMIVPATWLVSLRIVGGDTWSTMSLLPDQVGRLAQLPHLTVLEALINARGDDVPNPLAGQLVFRNLRHIRSSVQLFTDLRECTFPALRQAIVVIPYDVWPLVNTVPVPNMPLLTAWTITGVIDETMKGKELIQLVPIGDTVQQRAPMLAEVQLRIPARQGWLLQYAPKLV